MILLRLDGVQCQEERIFYTTYFYSRWPHGLKRWSVTAPLCRLQVRISNHTILSEIKLRYCSRCSYAFVLECVCVCVCVRVISYHVLTSSEAIRSAYFLKKYLSQILLILTQKIKKRFARPGKRTYRIDEEMNTYVTFLISFQGMQLIQRK